MKKHSRARNTDPSTSHLAANSIKTASQAHAETIIDCLQRYGALGKDGIAAHTNLESMQVARRLHELEREGMIELTGKVVKSRANRLEREWRFIPQQVSLL